MPTSPPCPCGGEDYERCCGRYHHGEAVPSAELLMRSRYSAYALGLEDYLRHSWHPDTCPDDLSIDPELHWFKLQIRQTQRGGPNDSEGRVSFVARFKKQGRAARLEEDSRFARYQGRWVYLDGQIEDK